MKIHKSPNNWCARYLDVSNNTEIGEEVFRDDQVSNENN